jgi:TetR/AcrR family transcriptional regulator, mexJK operon transcriptional repressor
MVNETKAPPRGRGTRQDAIREAAQRLFLAHGFAGTTTDAITAAAGVSKETLYRYYPGKEAVFADVLGRLTLDRPGSSPLDALVGADPTSAAALRRVLSDLAARVSAAMFQPDYLALVQITIAEASRFPDLGALFRKRVPERALAAVEDLLRRAQERGVIAAPDARAAAYLLLGPLVAHLVFDGLLAPGGEPRPPSPEELESLVDLVMNALMGPSPS